MISHNPYSGSGRAIPGGNLARGCSEGGDRHRIGIREPVEGFFASLSFQGIDDLIHKSLIMRFLCRTSFRHLYFVLLVRRRASVNIIWGVIAVLSLIVAEFTGFRNAQSLAILLVLVHIPGIHFSETEFAGSTSIANSKP